MEEIPYELEVEDDGTVIISDPITLCYGVGGNAEEALADYKASLIEYKELMNERGIDVQI